MSHLKFQSTHPHGVRHRKVRRVLTSRLFQSTHPHGVRHFNGVLPRAQYGVSIHAPTWGATWYFVRRCTTAYVSIHAPTWGATQYFQELSYSNYVSIHAPTWGATSADYIVYSQDEFQSTHPHGVRHSAYKSITLNISFNPRTHMGCDTKPFYLSFACLSVSIHAPTWGATTFGFFFYFCAMFQSTHPHGVRPSCVY